MIPKHIFVSLLLIMIVGLSFFSVGCITELNNSTPSEDMISVNQAKDLVRNYTGSPYLALTLNSTHTDSYLLESEDYMYYVNRTSGSVYLLNPSTPWRRVPPGSETIKPLQPEIIDFEQGRSIAEAYTRVNNPDLFQESSKKELVFRSEITDNGNWGRGFEYVWEEYLYYPDKFTEPHLVIAGPNITYITVNPYTGEISFHFSSSVPPDPTLSLNPTLTEEQALELAKIFAAKQFYFTERGITPDPSEWTSEGLRVFPEHDKTQHLAWCFDVMHRMAPDSYLIGGGVNVDAHTGDVISFGEIG